MRGETADGRKEDRGHGGCLQRVKERKRKTRRSKMEEDRGAEADFGARAARREKFGSENTRARGGRAKAGEAAENSWK